MVGLAVYSGRLAAPTRELSRLAVAVFVLYSGFLVAVYLGWFDGEHSYFRYNTQLSLLITLALARAARDWLGSERCLTIAGTVLLAVLMIGPLAWPHPLRFDRTMPQPWLQAAARNLAGAVDD